MRKRLSRAQIKGEMLRVRLTESEAESLNACINATDEFPTISAMVRNMIREATMEGTTSRSCPLTEETYKKIEKLGKELGRTPAQVVADCVDGIVEHVEKGRDPLIAAELRLRRDYAAKK